MPVSLRDDYPLGAAAAGACYSCHSGRRDLGYGRAEQVVDLGVFIDMEGHLCICESCVREAAALLGMVTPEQRDDAVAHAQAMEADRDAAVRERDLAMATTETVMAWRERSNEVGVPEPSEVTA